MDQTHIHLLITHLPIFGSILGAIVLAYGLAKRNQQTFNAAYLVLIISSIGAFIANQTGEAAEETVEHIQGISKDLIHEHEESAEIALIAAVILAVISILALFAAYRNWPYSNTLAWIILVVSLATFGFVARTGYLGGKIRHSEINSNAAIQENTVDQEDE